MTLKRTGSEELEDAARLQALFYEWQAKQQASGMPSSQAEAARLLGFGQSAVSQYLNGSIPLNFRAASKFAELLRCSIHDISPTIANQARNITERVEASRVEYDEWRRKKWLSGPTPGSPKSAGADVPQESQGFPLIRMDEIAEWVRGGPTRIEPEAWMGSPVDASRNAFYFRVRGDSMNDPTATGSFRDGDLVLMEPTTHAEHGEFVVVRESVSAPPVFRQIIIEGGSRYLKALNPSWPDRITRATGSAQILAKAKVKVVIL